EHHDGELRNEEGDRERIHYHPSHLDDGEPGPRRDVRKGAAQVGHEMDEAADGLDGVDGPSADALDHGAKLTSHVARCTLPVARCPLPVARKSEMASGTPPATSGNVPSCRREKPLRGEAG